MAPQKEIVSVNSTKRIKILNDEKLSSVPIQSIQVHVQPTDDINTLRITKSKSTPVKQKQAHYVMETIKSENNSSKIGSEGLCVGDGDSFDFVLTEHDDEPVAENESIKPVEARTNEYILLVEGIGENAENNTQAKDVGEHVCNQCYKQFHRLKSLNKHLVYCSFDSNYHLRKAEMLRNLEKIEKDAIIMENKDICFCCSESYDTFHLGHINCPDCPKSFKTQTSYERHIFITHSEFDDYPCTVCNAKLRSANLLKLHEEQHKNRGKPYACKICGKDFTRSYHLKRHQKYSSCSVNENDTMSCKVCDRVFYRLDNLRSHLKMHLGTQVVKKPEYTCHICKNQFYSLSTLNIHIRTHTGEKPFECDLCDKKFPALVALKKHRRYHTGERPYTCTVCNQSFAVKEVLNRHVKRHTGERPHKCNECGKTFIQATQLRTHSRTHVRPFECCICNGHYKTKKQLDRHFKEHTRTKRDPSKKFKCDICKLGFPDMSELREHMEKGDHILPPPKKRRTNANIERTDCAICVKDFVSVEKLRQHIREVHETDPDVIFGQIKTEVISPPAQKRKSATKRKSELKTNLHSSNTDDNHCAIKNNNNGIVVREFIVDELSVENNSAEQTIVLDNETYTVIPLENSETTDSKPLANIKTSITTATETKPQLISELKKEQRKTLAESLAAAIADDDNASEAETMTDQDLKLHENLTKLIDVIIDKPTLKKYGWPNAPHEIVLRQVISNCGYDLSKDSIDYDGLEYFTRLREYIKLLFTVVIQNDSIKELLNNFPIDEVVEYVLGEDNDDNDNDDDDDEPIDDKSAALKA